MPAWGSVRDTFESVNPATGEVLATYGIDGEREVAAAVRRARGAAEWWGGLSFADRRLRLLAKRRRRRLRLFDRATAYNTAA